MIYQAYNRRINAWVKYKLVRGKLSKIIQVKKINPNVPFLNIKIKHKKE